jgi:hypothetical protein
MFSKLLLASVATIGLLLAGPQKASAQTVFSLRKPDNRSHSGCGAERHLPTQLE